MRTSTGSRSAARWRQVPTCTLTLSVLSESPPIPTSLGITVQLSSRCIVFDSWRVTFVEQDGQTVCGQMGRIRASRSILPVRHLAAKSRMVCAMDALTQTTSRTLKKGSDSSSMWLGLSNMRGYRFISLHPRGSVRVVSLCVRFFTDHLARQLEHIRHDSSAVEIHSWESVPKARTGIGRWVPVMSERGDTNTTLSPWYRFELTRDGRPWISGMGDTPAPRLGCRLHCQGVWLRARGAGAVLLWKMGVARQPCAAHARPSSLPWMVP